MDPIKIVIFVAAFLLLLLLGRKLSAAAEAHPYQPPPEPAQPAAASLAVEDESSGGPRRPAATGADLPFPVQLPVLAMDADGKYNRPEFLNYFFSTTDLVQGPSDPTAFIDDFFMETRNPEDDRVFIYKYVICTPAGLQRVLDKERLPSLYMEDDMIVVPRWNLPAILSAVTEEIMKLYRPDEIQPGISLPENEETEMR